MWCCDLEWKSRGWLLCLRLEIGEKDEYEIRDEIRWNSTFVFFSIISDLAVKVCVSVKATDPHRGLSLSWLGLIFCFWVTSEPRCLIWWNCPRSAKETTCSDSFMFPVCNSDHSCFYLPWCRLFVMYRRNHRLRASVWGAAGGYHLPRGVAWGKNHHELPGSGQSTCHIQVTYALHKACLTTACCAFCVLSAPQPVLRLF